MKSINVIDALSNQDGSFDAVCEIPYKLAQQLTIQNDGTVDTADILRIAYWNAFQAELETEQLTEHLDLMDTIFNPDRPPSRVTHGDTQELRHTQ